MNIYKSLWVKYIYFRNWTLRNNDNVVPHLFECLNMPSIIIVIKPFLNDTLLSYSWLELFLCGDGLTIFIVFPVFMSVKCGEVTESKCAA